MNAEKTAKRFMQRVSQSCTGMNPQREFELLNQLINIIKSAQQPLALDVLYEVVEQKFPCQSCGATNTIRVPIARN